MIIKGTLVPSMLVPPKCLFVSPLKIDLYTLIEQSVHLVAFNNSIYIAHNLAIAVHDVFICS